MGFDERELRTFLEGFTTAWEATKDDTGFFRDQVKRCVVFIRLGKRVDEISYEKLEQDPYGQFNKWRRQFANTNGWSVQKGGDKDGDHGNVRSKDVPKVRGH